MAVDDEPVDGPQHYILLVGFFQPRLIGALDAIGVHVANVIKLYSEHTHTSEERQGQHSGENGEQDLTSASGKELPVYSSFTHLISSTFLST